MRHSLLCLKHSRFQVFAITGRMGFQRAELQRIMGQLATQALVCAGRCPFLRQVSELAKPSAASAATLGMVPGAQSSK